VLKAVRERPILAGFCLSRPTEIDPEQPSAPLTMWRPLSNLQLSLVELEQGTSLHVKQLGTINPIINIHVMRAPLSV
jgi:hypothetical protein